MRFNKEVFDLLANKNRKINLIGLKLPSNQTVFFRSKQQEIIDQYATARLFMYQTETTDWDYWFQSTTKPDADEYFKIQLTANFYESALIFYNIVVDLSWVLCYVSAEYAVYKNNTSYDFNSLSSIDEAVELLRLAERNVTNPSAPDSPFAYLKDMNPEFSSAIEIISNFWKEFSNSNIRKTYNYIKHKGKPLYEEKLKYDNTRFFAFQQQNKSGETISLPSDIKDIQNKLSLSQEIEQLKQFDNDVLYPYIEQLFLELERIIDPSPLIF